ncbi:hypothetical protein P3X46_032719 [Hevea brasiliensis]|uniref:Reverse transcriptase domain-containing protein n=1 Tax=Hevea brasiliensis TaxID=3981 RepID=A0ABQ9KFS2_HEVBR|nr:hypothetical protein P3X46_032719 [Hevea brasiliensis]
MIRESSLSAQSISQRGPRITHLLFADDSILFSKATTHEAELIDNILKNYAELSGQLINFDKSTLIFSRNTHGAVKSNKTAILNIKNISSHDCFLGLPSTFPRSKKVAFALIKERIQRKIAGWKEKNLSQGGKEVLIKTVTQAIPVYAMSCLNFLSLFAKILIV